MGDGTFKAEMQRSLAAIHRLDAAARVEIFDAFNDWFERNDDESMEGAPTPSEVESDSDKLNDWLWSGDPIAAEGGVCDFLFQKKLLRVEFDSLQEILNWQFVGNHESDMPAFEAIDRFILKSSSVEERIEAMNHKANVGMDLDLTGGELLLNVQELFAMHDGADDEMPDPEEQPMATFTVKVFDSRTSVHVDANTDDAAFVLRRAIEALVQEQEELGNCPVHQAQN